MQDCVYIGHLYGLRLRELVDTWRGSLAELIDRYNFEGHGYWLEISDSNGNVVADLRLD